jgi:hemolysin type calcium-binding protein/WD40 repeat protein
VRTRKAAVAGIALLLALPAAAQATFPGANGKIGFSRCEDPACNSLHIWSMNPDGSGQAQVTSFSAGDEDSAYSANGARITFEYCPASGGCGIAVANADGSGQVGLTDPGPGNFDDYPAFFPDGSKIVFAGFDGRIQVIPAAGGTPAPLSAGPNDSAPDVSPDGTKIVFGGNGQITVMGADGSNPTAITTPPAGGFDESPSFAPDGSKVVFQRRNSDGTSTIAVVPVGGGTVTPLHTIPSTGSGGEPVFSPDGTKIAFEECDSSGCNTAIQVMNADGSGIPAPLTGGGGEGDFRAAWQPAAPIFGGPPAVTGTAVNGQTLGAAAAPVSGATGSSFQWLRCDKAGNGCVPIAGALATTYRLTTADIGHAVGVRETSTNAVGSSTSDSAPTKAVAPSAKRCSNVFTGTGGRNFFAGTVGGDRISGLGGNDDLAGGPGRDCISGGSGNDKITGGTGNDTLSGGSGRDKISGGPGNDRISGGAGNDTISAGSGSNVVSGGAGNDRIDVVNGHRDRVNCGGGRRDVVHADAKDRLRGCERVIVARKRGTHRKH